MAVTVHIRPTTPAEEDRAIPFERAGSWTTNVAGGLDLLDQAGELVATFAGASWLYAETGS